MKTPARPDLTTTLAGTLASLAVTGAVAALARGRGMPDHLPDRHQMAETGRHALHGARDYGRSAWHGAASMAHAVPYESWLPARSMGPLTAALGGGAIMAGLAALADWVYAPRALTPDYKSEWPERTATGAFAVLALGLAAGAAIAYARQPAPGRGWQRWLG